MPPSSDIALPYNWKQGNLLYEYFFSRQRQPKSKVVSKIFLATTWISYFLRGVWQIANIWGSKPLFFILGYKLEPPVLEG